MKGVREIGVIERASAGEIQRKLLEVMVGVLDGRMETEEALAIGMVAEEQIRMLNEESKGPRVEELKGSKVEMTKGKDRFARWVN